LDVPSLTREAGLIVVGQATSVREEERGNYEIRGQMMPARRMVVELRVDRVMKGEAGATVAFRFFSTDQFVGYKEVVASQFGMFFLRPASESILLASPYYPSIVAAQEVCATEGDDLARVTAELACVLHSTAMTIRGRAEAISALATVKTAKADSALKRAAQELPEPLSLLAASVMLSRNDISMLPLLEETLQHSSKLVVQDVGYSTQWNAALALEGIKDKAAIPALARLLESQEVETRRGAAQALRHIGTEAALEPLSKALYDGDWEVRWKAVMGLAGIVGADSWYPAYDSFKQDEQRYLNHWREWAQQRTGKR